MMSGRHVEVTCPYCHAEMDAWADPHEPSSPKPNDLTLCMCCSAMVAFADDGHGGLRLRRPTERETLSAQSDPIFAILSQMVADRNGPAIRRRSKLN